MLITRPFMMLAVLASGFTGLVAGQGQAGTLAWGQTLPQVSVHAAQSAAKLAQAK